MADKLTFSQEISNLMYEGHGSPLNHCIQCGTCSGTCPAVEFMDQTPRRLIGMINADLKDDVLDANTYWTCASCYHCTVRCPAKIDIAGVMYAVKRYSMWHHENRCQKREIIRADFGTNLYLGADLLQSRRSPDHLLHQLPARRRHFAEAGLQV